ncbi:acyl-CoA N-acyltransferase, partial [Flagelloscypha sp. PMI_526]
MTLNIRPFRTKDYADVSRIFMEGMATRPGSPSAICLHSQWTWPSSLLCYGIAIASFAVYVSASSPFTKLFSVFSLLASLGFVGLVRMMIKKGLRSMVEKSLQEDMKDIPTYYGLIPVDASSDALEPENLSCLWVAEYNNKLVGFVAFDVKPETKIGELRHMAVSPNHRGLGIGSSLVRHLVGHAMKHLESIDHIFLYVGKYQPGAIAMYEKVGFKRVQTDFIPMLRIPVYKY